MQVLPCTRMHVSYRITMYLQTQKFSPAHLLELALEVFSLTYPDMWSLTPYKCKHQTEKKMIGK